MRKAIIISCFGWYNGRLYHLFNRLENNGYQVKLYTSDYSHVQKKRVEKIDRLSYIHVPAYRKNTSIMRVYSHFCFAKKCAKMIKADQPDLLYVVTPPNIAAKTAAKYKAKHPNTKLVVDIIDLWPESFPNPRIRKTLVFLLWKKMRDYALKQADHIVLECDYYREFIGDEFLNKCSTLRLRKESNSSDIEEIQRALRQTKESFDDKRISLCYLGSVNNIVDLKSIEEVLHTLHAGGYSVDFHFIGKGSSKQALLSIAERNSCIVHDHGAIFDEDEKRKILTACDFGINMMKSSIIVGLTIKSIDYLKNALPLLNNIKGDTWSLVEQNQIGINYDGSQDYFLDRIRTCKIQDMKKYALQSYLDCFSRDSFESTFDNIIHDILS